MYSVFESPNPILFGCGTSALLGEKLKELGLKKVLAIYDKGVFDAGLVTKMLDTVKASGIDIITFDKVEPDPPDYLVNEAAELGLKENVCGIVGIGGGSSVDTAKGVRLLLTYPAPINQYFAYTGFKPDESKLKPCVVIPTTSGTGSEATPGGIITDTHQHIKYPLLCGVSLAIIDPELTTGLPSGLTATTGFDAFCHAVEALTSRAPNPISEILARESITLIAKYLPTACKDGANIEAREGMALAASLAGISLRGPFGGVPHDIGKFIGIRYNIPHGTAVGCLIAECMKFIAPVVPDKLYIIAACMNVQVKPGATDEELGQLVCDAIRKLYKEVGMPPMSSFVKSREELLENADALYKGASFTPRPLTGEDVVQILVNSYDNN